MQQIKLFDVLFPRRYTFELNEVTYSDYRVFTESDRI
jgi:hypothetical protein